MTHIFLQTFYDIKVLHRNNTEYLFSFTENCNVGFLFFIFGYFYIEIVFVFHNFSYDIQLNLY